MGAITVTDDSLLLKTIDLGANKVFLNGSLDYAGSVFVTFEDKIFFLSGENTYAKEPWISDGTQEGTNILKDINSSGNLSPSSYVALDNKGKDSGHRDRCKAKEGSFFKVCGIDFEAN
ncbi:MAG: hypothetical protein F6K26_37925 [Moorea sp. SIO2I5]|nr:hypothetical protein [Moorena sp. SIO2I5]